MNRIDRLSAILIHLQSKKWVTAGEIADRFSMSLRTVYRDLKALEEAGVPVGAEAGKGYYLVDGYRLPPVMFTREEAGAMLMAEKMVEKFTDNSVKEHYQSAMYKIKSVLPDIEKQFVSDLNCNIEVYYTPKGDSPNNFMSLIHQALVNNQVLHIEYFSISKEEHTCREIEPVGLCFYSISWHLIAYCRLRNEYRDFRVDRIKNLTLGNEKFVPREKITMREYFQRYSESRELSEVVLRVNKKAEAIFQTVKYYYGFLGEEERNGFLEMDFVSDDLDYFGRWLLMYADCVEVVKPLKLKTIMQDLVASIKNNFL
jgi:predicted DNA-binding transcriptional regulator YafY